jgi:hypothetical protein
MIDALAAVLGAMGSTLNMTLSPKNQIYGLMCWLCADVIIIIFLWGISWWLVGLNAYYIFTCCYGIYHRKNLITAKNNTINNSFENPFKENNEDKEN